mmetsp:Transcript_35306/g.55134  ORF Transcript_35306/g.55134 Transcript_35306/m.55134 type:complete len:82 (+) Transcript_35306:1287-1532(+)
MMHPNELLRIKAQGPLSMLACGSNANSTGPLLDTKAAATHAAHSRVFTNLKLGKLAFVTSDTLCWQACRCVQAITYSTCSL